LPEQASRGAGDRWSRVAERGSLLGMRITVACYRFAGRPVALALVHAIVTYFFLTDRAGRRASAAYLRRVYATKPGREALGRRPSLWTSFLHYRAFALSIADRVELWLGRAESFQFESRGSEVCDRFAAEGRGYIVLGSHLGSFDALRLLAKRQQRCVNVLMFTTHAAQINRLFRELSPEAEARVIHVSRDSVRAIFEIRERLRRGEIIAVLGDRIEAGDLGRSAPVQLLGDPVRLPQSPYLIAALVGCPIVFMTALRTGARRYEVNVELLAENVRAARSERDKRISELVAAYAGRLEHTCLRAPLQWFNFYDYWGDAQRAGEVA
jgi:predicted LPLAT superfamily acyltransferase